MFDLVVEYAMPVYSEIVHFGVTQVLESSVDRAVKIAQAPYPELYSPIETGIYVRDGELVLCLSTQSGCALGCTFCESAKPPYLLNQYQSDRLRTNLTAAEIVFQTLNALEVAKINRITGLPLLFSFMGMGEPLNNYDQLQLAIKILGKMFPYSRVTISTICQQPQVVATLADDIAQGEYPILVKLHFSLHASNDELRHRLMPAATPLQETIAAMTGFMAKTGLPVKANYLFINGVNNLPQHEDELVRLLAGTGIILKISDLNSPNPKLMLPSAEADAFAQRISQQGITTCRFTSLGQNVHAGCGQFVASVNK